MRVAIVESKTERYFNKRIKHRAFKVRDLVLKQTGVTFSRGREV